MKISPFLWFDSQAEVAAKLYISIFKNSKIQKITRYPKEAAEKIGRPPGSVMTVEFQLEGVELYLGSSRRARPLPCGFSGHVAHPFRSIRRAPGATRAKVPRESISIL